MPLHSFLLATALIVEAVAGYPDPLYARIRHPVVWIGALIAQLDLALNHETDGFGRRKAFGVLAVAVLLLTVGGVAVAVAWVCRLLPFGWLVEAALASTLLAQRSLHDHVAAVAKGFRTGGLEGARKAVSMIVGRNPAVGQVLTAALSLLGGGTPDLETVTDTLSDLGSFVDLINAVAGTAGLGAVPGLEEAVNQVGVITDALPTVPTTPGSPTPPAWNLGPILGPLLGL